MKAIARYLRLRVVLYAAMSCFVGGLLGWIVAVAETRRAWELGFAESLWLIGAVALLLSPAGALVAVAWLCVRLQRGSVDLLASCGVARESVGASIGRSVLAVLLTTAIAFEVCVPFARDILAPLVAWEKRSHTPALWVVDDTKIALRFGDRLSHLTDAWIWNEGAPAHYADLRYDTGAWRSAGNVVAGIPEPSTLIAERPYLYELLAVWELGEIGLRGPAGTAIFERLLRPWYWWLWLTALAHLLLARRRSLAVTAVIVLGWSTVGVTLLMAAHSTGVAMLFVPLLVAGVVAWLLSGSRSGSRRIVNGVPG